jgi:hypothetical protein
LFTDELFSFGRIRLGRSAEGFVSFAHFSFMTEADGGGRTSMNIEALKEKARAAPKLRIAIAASSPVPGPLRGNFSTPYVTSTVINTPAVTAIN